MNKYAALVGTLKHEVYTYVASNEQKATHYYLRRERDGMGWDGMGGNAEGCIVAVARSLARMGAKARKMGFKHTRSTAEVSNPDF